MSRLLYCAHYLLNRAHHALEALRFTFELRASFPCQAVKSRAAIVFGDAPFGSEPTFHQHAIEGRIEGPVFDLQVIARGIADAFRDRIAVQRTGAESTQDQQVESPRKQLRTGVLGHTDR